MYYLMCDFVVTYYFVKCFVLCWKCLRYHEIDIVIIMDVITKGVKTPLKNSCYTSIILLCSEKSYIVVVIEYLLNRLAHHYTFRGNSIRFVLEFLKFYYNLIILSVNICHAILLHLASVCITSMHWLCVVVPFVIWHLEGLDPFHLSLGEPTYLN